MEEKAFMELLTGTGAGGLTIAIVLFIRSVMKGFGRAAEEINKYLKSMTESLETVKTSIVELNGKLKVQFEKSHWHEKTLDDHNGRLNKLEGK